MSDPKDAAEVLEAGGALVPDIDPPGDAAGSEQAPKRLDPIWKTIGELCDDLDDWLLDEPPPQDWLLHQPDGKPLLSRGAVGLLAAPGGRGKTMLAVQLALAVATGRDWVSYKVDPKAVGGRVLLALAEEDLAEARRRLFAAASDLLLTREEIAAVKERIVVLGLAGQDVSLVDVIAGRAAPSALHAEFVERLEAHEYSLVILDPLSRWAPQIESDNSIATGAVQALERLAQASRGTVIVPCHTAKWARREENVGDAEVVRGVTALTDGVRWVAIVKGNSESDLELCVAKVNGAPKPSAGVELIRGDRGVLRVPNSVDLDTRRVEKAAADRVKITQVRDAVVASLRTAPGITLTQLRTEVRGLVRKVDSSIVDKALASLVEDGSIEDRREGNAHRYHLRSVPSDLTQEAS